MDDFTKSQIMSELNNTIIEQASSWFFESGSMNISISKDEALRIEETYSSVVVEPHNGSAFLRMRKWQ